MKISLVEEMRRMDKEAAEIYGVAEIVLMENAGKQTADAAAKLFDTVEGKEIILLAGSGNNGGDAFVAARHLLNYGAKVNLYLVGNPEHMTPSAKANYKILENMGIKVKTLRDVNELEKLRIALLRCADGIIDGMLGTGFKGKLRELHQQVIRLVNASGLPVLSIDIPTGVEADTGSVTGEAVKADMTLSLGLPKPGQMICPGASYVGELLVDAIGMPNALLTDERLKLETIDDAFVRTILPQRARDVHKGSCGRVLVIAGSRGMTGAAALSSMSVLRVGAGISVAAVAESLHDIMENKLTEVMTKPISEEKPGCLTGSTALKELMDASETMDTVLIGPGLGRDEETSILIRQLAPSLNCPVVLDADGIYAFWGHVEELKSFRQIPILTPHLGEMAGLLSVPVMELKGALVNYVREAALEYHAIFVVKSECTVVAYPDGRVYFTTKGNPGMATAGCGDVLSGTIAGLVKQTSVEMAPLLGVYLHGLSGDFAYAASGNGMVASDLMNMLPKAFMSLY